MTPRWLILFLVTVVLAGCNFTSADTYLQQSRLAVEKEDYRSAINLLTKAIQKDPGLKEAYLQRGFCFQNVSQKDSAIDDYKKLLRIDPTNTSAWYYSGLCNYSNKKYDEAVDNYNRALITKGIANPADTSVVHITDTTAAITHQAVNSTDISTVQLFYQRGLAYYAAQQPQKAYRDFQTCIAQKYNLDECIYLSSVCWTECNKNNTPCDSFKLNLAQGKNMAKNHLAHLCK